MGCARADKLRICVKVSLRHISANFYFLRFCVFFRVFAKVLDFAGMSMETFIRLWPILNFDSPRASNELTNDVWYVGIGRWGACQQMGPRMWILTDFQDCEISQKSANSYLLKNKCKIFSGEKGSLIIPGAPHLNDTSVHPLHTPGII